MQIVLNSLSFHGQFSDDRDALDALIEMADVAESSNMALFSARKMFFAEASLKDAMLTDDKTIHSLMAELMGQYSPEQALLHQRLLGLFIQKTRIIEEHQKDYEVNFNSQVINHTCVNFCFAGTLHHALFSCAASDKFEESIIQVEKNGSELFTLNIIKHDCLKSVTWINKDNNKKHVGKDVRYGKHNSSRMDLNGETAQFALSNSVRLPGDGSCLYFNSKQWYKFNFESENLAHGFCEATPNKQKNFNLAKRVFDDLQGESIGQVFIEYTKHRPPI